MKFGLSTVGAALCLYSLILPRASAQMPMAAEPQMERMFEEGWQTVDEGVLQRDLGEGRVETYTYGEQGRRWTARRLAERIAALEREHRAHPSDELAAILARLKGELRQTEQALAADAAEGELSLASASLSTGEIDSVSATLTAGCEPTVTLGANAAPLSTQVAGSTASAHVSFQAPTDCFGSTFAYAYSRATSGSTMNDDSQEDSQSNGTVLAVEVDGVNVTGPLTMPSTGGWNPTATITKTGVSLTAGRRVMRLVIDSVAAGQAETGTLDTITVQP